MTYLLSLIALRRSYSEQYTLTGKSLCEVSELWVKWQILGAMIGPIQRRANNSQERIS